MFFPLVGTCVFQTLEGGRPEYLRVWRSFMVHHRCHYLQCSFLLGWRPSLLASLLGWRPPAFFFVLSPDFFGWSAWDRAEVLQHPHLGLNLKPGVGVGKGGKSDEQLDFDVFGVSFLNPEHAACIILHQSILLCPSKACFVDFTGHPLVRCLSAFASRLD